MGDEFAPYVLFSPIPDTATPLMSAEFAEQRFGEIGEVTDAGVAGRLGGGACPDDHAGDGGWGEGELDRDVSEVVAIEDPKTFALGTNRIDATGDPS